MGKPRGQASASRLAQLGVSTAVEALAGARKSALALHAQRAVARALSRAGGCRAPGPLTPDVLGRFSVVVATRGNLRELVALDAACRARGVPLVVAATRSLFGYVFCDFGATAAAAL